MRSKYDQETRERALGMFYERREEAPDEAVRTSLRKEVAQLRRANEIMKTASAFFAAAEQGRRLK